MKEKPTMVVVPIEDWEEYQELKKKINSEGAFELKEGGDYFTENGNIIISVKRKLGTPNLGFSFGRDFCNNYDISGSKFIREAKEEEVIEAFEKECVRRLGEDWKEVKLKTHANGGTIHVNTGRHQPI